MSPRWWNASRILPGVAYAGENLFTCSQDAQQQIKKVIEDNNLNRVIVASCTPRTHLPLFQETAREAGLNKYLVEMANIREHCSWVHMQEKEKATEKAVDLIRMAVARTTNARTSAGSTIGHGSIRPGDRRRSCRNDLCSEHRGPGIPGASVEATDKLGGNALKLLTP